MLSHIKDNKFKNACGKNCHLIFHINLVKYTKEIEDHRRKRVIATHIGLEQIFFTHLLQNNYKTLVMKQNLEIVVLSKANVVNTNMEISVIVTAYNREEYLGEALNSIFRQTLDFSKFEVIVITNFQYKLPPSPRQLQLTHIIMEGTIGQFLYKGLMEANGNIISFLDDDDIWHNERLQQVLNVFNSNPDISYYHNSPWYIDGRGRALTPYFQNPKRVNKGTELIRPASMSEISKLINLGSSFNLSSIAVHRTTLTKSIKLIKAITASQDSFFFWNAILAGKLIYQDNKILTGYRMHETNTSLSENNKMRHRELIGQLDTLRLLQELCEATSLNGLVYRNLQLQQLELQSKYIMNSRGSRVTLFSILKRVIKLKPYPTNLAILRLFLYAASYSISFRMFARIGKIVSISGHAYI